MVLASDNAPLPKHADEQNWRKNQVDKIVRHQHDADTDDQESHENEWCVDAEGTLDLASFETQQQ